MRIRGNALVGRWLGGLICALVLAAPALGEEPARKAEVPEKPRAGEAPRGAVLSGPKALEVARDACWEPNQPRPTDVALWQPRPADVARLEKLLPAFMSSQKTPLDYQPLHEYYRQYIGIIHKGKKTIYVNLFHYIHVGDLLRSPPEYRPVPPGARPEVFWKYDPVCEMDGGAYFFQVEFDVKTGTFMNLRFNGYA